MKMISKKVLFGTLLISAMCTFSVQATEQGQQRREARDTRQDTRSGARDTKQECRKADDKSNHDCRQDKRSTKQDGRQEARDIKY